MKEPKVGGWCLGVKSENHGHVGLELYMAVGAPLKMKMNLQFLPPLEGRLEAQDTSLHCKGGSSHTLLEFGGTNSSSSHVLYFLTVSKACLSS